MTTYLDLKRIGGLLTSAKKIAKEYRELTGKPLGITGEVGEYEAARILCLRLEPARQAGYDAVDPKTDKKIQIKARCLPPKYNPGQRLGKIDLQKEWDSVVLVLLDQDFEPAEIREAERADVESALTAPGSISRNKRGALSLSKFKSISECRWRRD